MNKINIYPIVRDHISTLRNNRTDKFSWTDTVFFFGVPVIAASLLIIFDKTLNGDARNIFGITLAVLVGLLFNVLLLIHTITKAFEGQTPRRRRYLQEVYFNIAFSVLIAMFGLVFLMVTVFFSGETARWLSGVVYYFAAVFVLTLMMVLKRLHFLFSDQFSA